MHWHYALSAFIMFVLGWAVHTWGKATVTVRSSLNGIKTYAQYITVYGANLGGRVFLNLCVFGIIVDYPQDALMIGQFIGPVKTFAMAHPGPIVLFWPLAGLLGWCSDSVLDLLAGLLSKRIPWLQPQIPPEPGGNGKPAGK